MSLATKSLKSLREEVKADIDFVKSIQAKGDDATPDEIKTAESRAVNAKSIAEYLANAGNFKESEAVTTAVSLFDREMNPPELPTSRKSADDGQDWMKGFIGTDGASVMPALWNMPNPGRFVTGHPTFKAWLKSIAPQGRVGQGYHQSPAFGIDLSPGALADQPWLKTLVTSSNTSGGGLIWSERRPDLFVDLKPFRPFTFLDMITRIRVSGNSIDLARLTGWTNNAAIVAAATSSSGNSGTKPESAMTFEQINVPIRTIAHGIPINNETLADAPALMDLMNTFLQEGLKEALEAQCLTADGTGTNFDSLLSSDANIDSISFATDLITTARKAITQIKTNGKVPPTGFVMSPANWEAIDLAKDNELRYYYGGPQQMGMPRLWGLPVAEALAMPDDTLVVGKMSEAILLDRQQTEIRMFEQHSDWAMRNMTLLRAELRAGFFVRYPNAFVKFGVS